MNRFRLFLIWLLVMVTMPILLAVMLLSILFGNKKRGFNMAISFDQMANSMFGGFPQETISSRTGKAFLAGAKWAKVIAPAIDLIFGKGHCVSSIENFVDLLNNSDNNNNADASYNNKSDSDI